MAVDAAPEGKLDWYVLHSQLEVANSTMMTPDDGYGAVALKAEMYRRVDAILQMNDEELLASLSYEPDDPLGSFMNNFAIGASGSVTRIADYTKRAIETSIVSYLAGLVPFEHAIQGLAAVEEHFANTPIAQQARTERVRIQAHLQTSVEASLQQAAVESAESPEIPLVFEAQPDPVSEEPQVAGVALLGPEIVEPVGAVNHDAKAVAEQRFDADQSFYAWPLVALLGAAAFEFLVVIWIRKRAA